MAELDWALAHMGGAKSKKRPKGKGKDVDWVYEAESKGGKGEVNLLHSSISASLTSSRQSCVALEPSSLMMVILLPSYICVLLTADIHKILPSYLKRTTLQRH
jgi:hypothetical protein